MTKTTVVLKTMGITKKTSVWACDISDHHPGMYVEFAQGGGEARGSPRVSPLQNQKLLRLATIFWERPILQRKVPLALGAQLAFDLAPLHAPWDSTGSF